MCFAPQLRALFRHLDGQKGCMLLWRAHLQVKMDRAEKIAGIVARSPLRSKHATKSSMSDRIWDVLRSTFPSQYVQNNVPAPEQFWQSVFKKRTRLRHERNVEVEMLKALQWELEARQVRTTFGCSSAVSCGRCNAQWALHLYKVEKKCGFCCSSQNGDRCGTLEKDAQRCMSRGGCVRRDISIRHVARSRHRFPEIWSIKSSGLLR